MGRRLGPFQREILQRIGKHMATFGETVKEREIAEDMALARGMQIAADDAPGRRSDEPISPGSARIGHQTYVRSVDYKFARSSRAGRVRQAGSGRLWKPGFTSPACRK